MKKLLIGTIVGAILLVALAVPALAANTSGGPGCVNGGKGFVGQTSGVFLNWHGSFVISLCPGATGPSNGDSDVQRIQYPDGTYEEYKIVYSTADLTASNGVFCYWDMTLDPTLDGPGYHCPSGSSPGHLYWYIVSSSGNSPYLEPAGSGGWASRPNGFGVYR